MSQVLDFYKDAIRQVLLEMVKCTEMSKTLKLLKKKNFKKKRGY